MQNYCTVWTNNQGETIFKLSSRAKTLQQKTQHAINIVASWDNGISDEEYHVRLAQYKEKWLLSDEEYTHILSLPIHTIRYVLHFREAIEILLQQWIITSWQFEKKLNEIVNIKK